MIDGSLSEDIIIGEYARVLMSGNEMESIVHVDSYFPDIITRTMFSLYGSPVTEPFTSTLPQTPGETNSGGIWPVGIKQRPSHTFKLGFSHQSVTIKANFSAAQLIPCRITDIQPDTVSADGTGYNFATATRDSTGTP